MTARWRGLKDLVRDAVEHGSRAVERIQIETAKTPFDLLERIAPPEVPIKGIHQIHDAAVSGVHGMIRLVNGVAGEALGLVIDLVDRRRQAAPTARAPEPPDEPR